jgi:hypothetical protein
VHLTNALIILLKLSMNLPNLISIFLFLGRYRKSIQFQGLVLTFRDILASSNEDIFLYLRNVSDWKISCYWLLGVCYTQLLSTSGCRLLKSFHIVTILNTVFVPIRITIVQPVGLEFCSTSDEARGLTLS